MLIDSHCHLDMLDLAPYDHDLDKLIADNLAAGVQKMITIGIDEKSSLTARDIAARYPQVFCSVGIHPSDVPTPLFTKEQIIHLSEHPKVVAIGETGLDYYYNSEGLDAQQQSFREHIQAAIAVQKPLIIHTRAAKADTLAIMREQQAERCGGVMHCFTEDWDMAKQALDMGFYISISGIVTFNKADNVREVAKQVPLDRLLIETDAPYLAPVPKRGKKNEPKYVHYVAEFMAELRGMALEDLIAATGDNASVLFGIS